MPLIIGEVMKSIILSFLLFLTFFCILSVVMSHGNGDSHENISSSTEKLKATEKAKQLAMAGKIDSSWGAVKPSSIEQKTPDHDLEWVVLFRNNKISNASKKDLDLFFSLDGDNITLNYDGN